MKKGNKLHPNPILMIDPIYLPTLISGFVPLLVFLQQNSPDSTKFCPEFGFFHKLTLIFD